MDFISLTKENSKYCKKCNTIKYLTDFASDRSKSSKITSSCKPCLKTKRQIYYQNNKDKFKKVNSKSQDNDMDISISF